MSAHVTEEQWQADMRRWNDTRMMIDHIRDRGKHPQRFAEHTRMMELHERHRPRRQEIDDAG